MRRLEMFFSTFFCVSSNCWVSARNFLFSSSSKLILAMAASNFSQIWKQQKHPITVNFKMDGQMFVILHPFQQYFSHIRTMGG